MTRLRSAAAAGVTLTILLSSPARANPASDALRAKAIEHIYNLDRDEAITQFRAAIAADPEDARAYRGLASALWMSITFRRGNMTVDDYLGRISKPSVPTAPPPPETVAAFREAVDKATALARHRLAENPRDASAHFELGAAVGLRASYTATVDGSASGAFRAAREAYNEHETVLALDPQRKDAGLIVGTYRYIVSALALPVRLMAYIVGFGGDKAKGLRMIEEAVAYGGENQEDARLALLLLYNREQRYDDALKILEHLRAQFPRNRLMWLETASTALRAGRPAVAEQFLTEGLTRFADDTRTRMFGEDAIWRYKRGAARVALRRTAEAEGDLKQALTLESRTWVKGRTHLELGKVAILGGNRARANEEWRMAVKLCESDNDPSFAEEARRLLAMK